MFARVFSIQTAPDQLEQGIQRLQESTPAVQALGGFRGGYFLVDRQSGNAMTITLWESEEAIHASLPAAREVLTGMMQAIGGGSLSEPQTYEVAVELQPSSS